MMFGANAPTSSIPNQKNINHLKTNEMEQKTKQSVLVFTDKRAYFSNGHRKPSGDYNKDMVMKELESIFPSHSYDIGLIDYERHRMFQNINEIWMKVRTPILIGCDSGANYIEAIKNYKRKYLISPAIAPSDLTIDEYDRENTVCLFGGRKKDIQRAEVYAEYYEVVHSEICDGELDLLEGVRYIGVYDLFIRLGNAEKKLNKED